MSDADLLAELDSVQQPGNAKGACKLCRLLEESSDEVSTRLEAALGGTLGGRRLSAILTRNGHPISATVIDMHRRKGH